jgi:hypothetical protein
MQNCHKKARIIEFMAGMLLNGRFRKCRQVAGTVDLDNGGKVVGMVDLANGRHVVGPVDLENGRNVVGPVDFKFMAGKLLDRISLKYMRKSYWADSFWKLAGKVLDR